MRLRVFSVFMLIVALATAIGSFMSGLGVGAIFLRIVIVLIALQVAYFAVLMLSAYFPKLPDRQASERTEAKQPKKGPIAGSQEN